MRNLFTPKKRRADEAIHPEKRSPYFFRGGPTDSIMTLHRIRLFRAAAWIWLQSQRKERGIAANNYARPTGDIRDWHKGQRTFREKPDFALGKLS